MATIRDVARESGVSVATVSYVLNNGPRPVRVATRQRVLEVVRHLNYHPNGMARGLARRRADTFGVLFPSAEYGIVTNTYAFGILQGILTAADELGFNITLLLESTRKPGKPLSSLLDRRTDGVLLVSPRIDSDITARLTALQVPLVGISVGAEMHGVLNVDVDNPEGARLATRHLLELGHTRIAHLTGDLDLVSGSERREGFLKTMALAGIETPDQYMVSCRYGPQYRERNKAIVRDLLSIRNPPTAIFAANDAIAISAIETAREIGLDVPGDLSVVGFDDIPSAALVTPALTSVRQPVAEIGRQATILLAEQLEGTGNSRQAMLLEPELIVRGSAARQVKAVKERMRAVVSATPREILSRIAVRASDTAIS